VEPDILLVWHTNEDAPVCDSFDLQAHFLQHIRWHMLEDLGTEDEVERTVGER
jgi:hypothetical protein